MSLYKYFYNNFYITFIKYECLLLKLLKYILNNIQLNYFLYYYNNIYLDIIYTFSFFQKNEKFLLNVLNITSNLMINTFYIILSYFNIYLFCQRNKKFYRLKI